MLKKGITILLQSNWCSSLYPGESNTKNSLSNYIEHQHKERNKTTFVIVGKTFALIIAGFLFWNTMIIWSVLNIAELAPRSVYGDACYEKQQLMVSSHHQVL